jgi:hypothetical protein
LKNKKESARLLNEANLVLARNLGTGIRVFGSRVALTPGRVSILDIQQLAEQPGRRAFGQIFFVQPNGNLPNKRRTVPANSAPKCNRQ